MPRPTKRQQQVKILSRKRGHFVSQELPSEVTANTLKEAFGLEWEEEELREVTANTLEEAFGLEWEKEELREVTANTSEEAFGPEWEEEELKEFEAVGKRFINEAL